MNKENFENAVREIIGIYGSEKAKATNIDYMLIIEIFKKNNVLNAENIGDYCEILKGNKPYLRSLNNNEEVMMQELLGKIFKGIDKKRLFLLGDSNFTINEKTIKITDEEKRYVLLYLEQNGYPTDNAVIYRSALKRFARNKSLIYAGEKMDVNNMTLAINEIVSIFGNQKVDYMVVIDILKKYEILTPENIANYPSVLKEFRQYSNITDVITQAKIKSIVDKLLSAIDPKCSFVKNSFAVLIGDKEITIDENEKEYILGYLKYNNYPTNNALVFRSALKKVVCLKNVQQQNDSPKR